MTDDRYIDDDTPEERAAAAASWAKANAEMAENEQRAQAAQAKAAQAFARLLHLAETRDSGQIRRVALVLAALYNGQAFPLDLYELRAVDVEIGDDMLSCIDALRWARADLHTLVPDGDRRVQAVIAAWGLKWPE
jgi:hypothetical protein